MIEAKYIPVLDNPTLVRDSQSKAILNTNVEGLKVHKQQREERMRVKRMLDEFDSVKSDLSEIKNLLKELLTK
jgi:hypothetical protein